MKRTLIAIVTALGSLVLVVAALWAVDSWARQQVVNYVTDKVQQVLSLESTENVDVRVAGFSVIAQVLTGSLDEIAVDVDEVQIGDLTGGVALTARGVPTDLTKPVDSVEIEFRVSEQSLKSVAHLLSPTAIDTVELVDGEVRFASEFRIFGFSIQVGIGVEPFADNGQIAFTPTSVELNGARTSAEELVSTFGGAAKALLQTQSFCVAKWLPAAFVLRDVVVDGKELAVTIRADDGVFDEASVRTFGTCPDSP
jgi:hypothetical protein